MADLLTPEEYTLQYSEDLKESLGQYDLQVNKLGVIGFFLNIFGNTRYDLNYYYQDLFKEAFPGTAQRDYNLYMHASIYGYIPGFATPSVASGKFVFDFALMPTAPANIVKREVTYSNIKFESGGNVFTSTYSFKFVEENGITYYGIVYDDKGGTIYIPASSSIIEIPFYNVIQETTKDTDIVIQNYSFGTFYPYEFTVEEGYLSNLYVEVLKNGETTPTPFEIKRVKYLEDAFSDVVFLKPLSTTRYILEFGSGVRGSYVPNSRATISQYLTNGTAGNLNVTDFPSLTSATVTANQTNNIGDVSSINTNVRNILIIEFTRSEGGKNPLTGDELRQSLVEYIQTRDNFISEQDYTNIANEYITDFKFVFRKLGVIDNIMYLHRTFRDRYMVPTRALNWTQQVILNNEYIIDTDYRPIRTTLGEKIYTTEQVSTSLTGYQIEEDNGFLQDGDYDYFVAVSDNFNESVISDNITITILDIAGQFNITCNNANTLTGGEYFTFSSPTENFYVWYEINIPDRSEESSIVCNDASTLSTVYGNYFLFSTTLQNYYAWYNVDGLCLDPILDPLTAPLLIGKTGIEIDVLSSYLGNTVALYTAIEIDSLSGITCGLSDTTVYLTNDFVGPSGDIDAGNTGFIATIITQGSLASIAGTDPTLAATGIKVSINIDDTSVTVATTTAAQINLNANFVATRVLNTLTITNVVPGKILSDPDPGSTGFVITNIITGINGNAIHLDWTPTSESAKYIIYGRKDSQGYYHRWETHDSEFIDLGDPALTGVLGEEISIVTLPGDTGFTIQLIGGGVAGSEVVTFNNHILTVQIENGGSTQANIADALLISDRIATATPNSPTSLWILSGPENDSLTFTPDNIYIPPTVSPTRQVVFNPTFNIHDRVFISPFTYVLNTLMNWYDGYILYNNFLMNFSTITYQNPNYELPIVYLNIIYDGVNRVSFVYIKSYQNISNYHFDFMIPTMSITGYSYGVTPTITRVDENTWVFKINQNMTDYGIIWDKIYAQIKVYDSTTGTPGTQIFAGETTQFNQIFDISDQLKIARYFDILGHEHIISIPVIDKEVFDSDPNYYLDAMFTYATENLFNENRMVASEVQFRFLNSHVIEAMHLRHLVTQAYDFVLTLPLKLKVVVYLNEKYVNTNHIDISSEKSSLGNSLAQLLITNHSGTSIQFYNSQIIDFVHSDRPYIKKVTVEVTDSDGVIIPDGLETKEDKDVITGINDDLTETIFERKLNILKYTPPNFYWDVDNLDIQFLY